MHALPKNQGGNEPGTTSPSLRRAASAGPSAHDGCAPPANPHTRSKHTAARKKNLHCVLEALESTGASLTLSLERERAEASEGLQFERAALLHKRLEKTAAALRGLPELVRRIENLDAVIIQRAAEPKTAALFAMRGGVLDGADYDVVHCRDSWSGIPVLEARARLGYAVVYDLTRAPHGESTDTESMPGKVFASALAPPSTPSPPAQRANAAIRQRAAA